MVSNGDRQESLLKDYLQPKQCCWQSCPHITQNSSSLFINHVRLVRTLSYSYRHNAYLRKQCSVLLPLTRSPLLSEKAANSPLYSTSCTSTPTQYSVSVLLSLPLQSPLPSTNLDIECCQIHCPCLASMEHSGCFIYMCQDQLETFTASYTTAVYALESTPCA